MPDYYKTLGVDRKASDDEIKRAYRKLAMKYHPDRNPNDAAAEKKFKEAAEAYEVLSDSNKKQQYDRFGTVGGQGARRRPTRSPMDDMFDFGFGGMGGRGRSQDPFGSVDPKDIPGLDQQSVANVTLEEAFEGCTKTCTARWNDKCSDCEGKGLKKDAQSTTCPDCNGRGFFVKSFSKGSQSVQVQQSCPTCRGAGTFVRPTDRCNKCKGEGMVSSSKSIEVKIPSGVLSGTSLRMKNQGLLRHAEGHRGDLYVVVNVLRHEIFEVNNRRDVRLLYPLSPSQAIFGDEIKVPTLRGDESVTVAPGTQHGQIHAIPRAGIPHIRGGGAGDMLVQYEIEMPKVENADSRSVPLTDLESKESLPGTYLKKRKIESYLQENSNE